MSRSLDGDGLGLVVVLQFPAFAVLQQFGHQFPSVLEFLDASVLLLVGVLAAGLQVQQLLVEEAVVLVEGVVVVAFLQQPLPFALEVLLGHLGLLLLRAFLPLEVFLGDVWVLPEAGLVVVLGGLDLGLDVLLPAAP